MVHADSGLVVIRLCNESESLRTSAAANVAKHTRFSVIGHFDAIFLNLEVPLSDLSTLSVGYFWPLPIEEASGR